MPDKEIESPTEVIKETSAIRTELFRGTDPLDDVEVVNGMQFRVRTPSMRERASILNGVNNANGDVEKIVYSQVQAAILLVEGMDGKPMFTAGDFDQIAEARADSTLDQVSNIALARLNLEGLVEKNG